MKQNDDAVTMLNFLMKRLLNGNKPIKGYAVAAKAIGLTTNHARHIGQVNSRVDVAAFHAGYPMIATHMVRTPGGKIHAASFRGVWEEYKSEGISFAENHRWTPEQLNEVRFALDILPDKCAMRLWEEIRERDAIEPGYIRRTLHHRCRG